MRRLLALLVAGALIVGALAVRGRLDAGEPLLPEATEAAAPLRLVCAAELAAACRAAQLPDGSEVVAQAAALTAAALADGTVEVDAWLVVEPWHDVPTVLADSAGAGSELSTAVAVATSPLVLVGWADRVDALAAACGEDALTWRCVGEQAGTPWRDLDVAVNGAVRAAHGDPTVDGIALPVLGGAVAGFFGRSDLAAFDLDDPAFAGWFAQLEGAAPQTTPGRPPLDDLRTRGRAYADVVGTTAAAARAAASNDELRVVETGAEVRAVLVGVGGAEVDGLVEPLRAALVDTGWRADAAPIEEDGDVPGAGFSVALQQRWDEAN